MGINPVGTYTDPDFESGTGTEYKTALDNSIRAGKRITDAFACHERSPADMYVTMDPGAILVDQTITEKTAQTLGPFSAPSGNPRIDRIVVNGITGVASIVAGTEAASPSPPALSEEEIPVAQIYLVVGQSSIVNADITDERLAAVATVVSVKDRVTTDAPVSGAAETTIYSKSIAGGTLGSNKSLFLYLLIDLVKLNTGKVVIWRLKYGSTTICSITFTAPSDMTTGHEGQARLEIELHADGATNAQIGDIKGVVGIPDDGPPAWIEYAQGSAAEDSTGALNLVVTSDSDDTSGYINMARAHLRKE